ncbi:SIS domain-containing protein [Vibrio sp. SS-MA-C1-2]|uniref:sugar isomerase domain-containing protein n=1 Tax=Vibrio sp. SS-MA-C1-2 TaxID=2908646 RepID=UPI001F3644D7|nr:SIS domain-containing protein [Vibrio sp. SS-MA-C1-2]UJF17777.1 SIS domain-containing protein [Vibrio sp. SS-MA-C1-2]
MSEAINLYLKQISSKLQLIKNNHSQYSDVACKVVDAIENGNSIYVFGASHAGIITEELTYRAGGLAIFNPIFNPSLMVNITPITLTSDLEKLPNFGKKIIESSKLKQGDILFIHSVSGRNHVIIDAAITAKSLGATIIGLTSVDTNNRVTSKHPSGHLLIDIVDFVLDNYVDYGDACTSISGVKQSVAPLSTVLGTTIANSLVLAITEQFVARGIAPPVLASANLDGNAEINRQIFEKYQQQIHYL